jgi:DNA glycosylase AlkZ-like
VDELTEALVDRVGAWAGEQIEGGFQAVWHRWRQAEGTVVRRGAMCFGPNRGRKVTYTNPRRWLPGFGPADERTALAELVQRYLHAYGPATPAQFAQWLASPRYRRWATDLFDSFAGELDRVELEGAVAWVTAGDTVVPSTPPTGVRLLPYFDAYAVGSHPRSLLFPGRTADRALADGQAGNFPVLLVGGTVAGVWHHRRTGRRLEVTVEPFHRLTAAHRRELDDQAEGIGEFLEADARLSIGTVTAGAHA